MEKGRFIYKNNPRLKKGRKLFIRKKEEGKEKKKEGWIS